MKYEKTDWVRYEKTNWIEEGSPDFVEGQSPAMDADKLNKIETGIFNNSKHLHRVSPILSYLAFVSGNDDEISAAFGKNNEDYFTDIGMSLAMYSWFKGADKSLHPFNELCNMSTLNDMNFNIYSEIIEDDSICALVKGNSYAKNKIFETYSKDLYATIDEKKGRSAAVDIVVTETDLKSPFRLSYEVYSRGNNSSVAKITLNGVVVGSVEGNGYRKEAELELTEWETYGITSAGTYNMKLDIYGYDSSSARSYAKFSLYKAKQYDN